MNQDRYSQLSAQQHAAFLDLAVANSPENITGDGEHSIELQNRMRHDLQRQWKALETQVGFTVSEDDVWKRESDSRAARVSGAPRRSALR